jgi:polar amino acid transport system substrate-binding protein
MAKNSPGRRYVIILVALVVLALIIVPLTLSSSKNSTNANGKAVFNAAAAALVPASYKGTTLISAMDATYAPDESIGNDGTTVIGFDVDLMKALAVTLGIKVQAQNVTFDNIIPGIQSGRYAIGNSSFTDNVTREASVNFVDYFVAGEGFYVKSSTPAIYTSLASLCGTSVAVESGTIEESDAQAQAAKCPANGPLRIASYPGQDQANLAVSSGHQTVGFLDSQIAAYVVKQSGGTFKLSGKPFSVAPYGIAVAKTTDGLKFAKALLAAFKVMKANGSYLAILKHWGVSGGALSKFTVNGAA